MQARDHCKAQYSGSVKTAPYFNPEKDAGVLYNSLSGIGNEEDDIIKLFSTRTNVQRQEIKRSYLATYEEELVHTLKAKTSGDFERILVALTQTPTEYDAVCLHKAMKGLGTDEKALIEILVTRSKDDIQKIKDVYRKKYGHELSKDIEEDASGDFKKLLLMLSNESRENYDSKVYDSYAVEDAKVLGGIKQGHSSMSRCLNILSSRSFPQLQTTFSEYKTILGKDILKTIDSEFSGDLKHALKAIVEVARYPPAYFSEALYRSMKGAGTDDTTLIRVVVSRSEIDMVDIKRSFKEKYGKSLEWYIDDDTSGPYRKMLNALI